MNGGWIRVLLDVVAVAILGVFLFYGQRQSAKLRGEEMSKRGRALAIAGLIGAAALTVWLLADASRRVYDLSPAGPTPGDAADSTVPTRKEHADAQQAGEAAKEATCQTAPGHRQAAMSDESCVFIASQIPVAMKNADPATQSAKTVPSPALGPGSDVPPDVKLKPLPAPVTERLTALQGFKYFLAGQDIVVVGRDEKVAFVVDVKVRPGSGPK